MSNTMINLRLRSAVSPAIVMLLLTGCMVGPKYHAPSPLPAATAPPATYKESPTQFQETDGWKVAQPQDAMLHGKWWEIYNDPELNALEEKLNIDNQNIKQFFENFMEARTLIAEARVVMRNASSRNRKLANVRARVGETRSAIAVLCNATSTTDCLPPDIRLSFSRGIDSETH